MLWGLAAASVPVVIHLLNRRRFQRQRWAAMEWLLLAARESQKRLRLESLLLLLLRTLAVLLLALALARPVLSASAIPLVETQHTHLFLLVDNSGSTAARSGLRSTLEDATATAAGLIGEIGADDPVTLVVTNDVLGSDRPTGRPRVVVGESHDHGKLRQLLAELRSAPARGDVTEALTALEETVPEPDGRHPKVAIVTDLQRVSFALPDPAAAAGAGAETKTADALTAVLERLRRKGAEVLLVPAGRDVENVGIVGIRPEEDRDCIAGARTGFLVDVSNFAPVARRVEVRFLVDGAARGESSAWVDLPPRGTGASPPTRSVRFSATFGKDEIGAHVVEAAITQDSFPLDDTRSFGFRVRPRLRILAVDGDPNPAAEQEVPENWYLVPSLAVDEGSGIDVHAIDDEEFLSLRSLDDWDMVILSNVARPAPGAAERERLDTYVRRGGALLLTVGDKTLPDVWNEELWRGGDGPLPAPFERADVRAEPWFKFDMSASRHPILRDITDPASAAYFQSTHLWGLMRLGAVDPARGASVVMRYTDLDSSPAMVERRFGSGRVLLLTTTVDRAWGDFPKAFFFPAFLHEAAYVLTSHGNAESNLSAFQTFSRTFPANFGGFEILYPDGSPARPQVESPADAPSYVTFGATDRLGTYRTTLSFRSQDVLAPPPPPEQGLFTVSLNALESDLERMSEGEVEARYPDLLRVAGDLGVAAARTSAGQSALHRGLLQAALVCLLLEVLVARRIGRRRTQR